MQRIERRKRYLYFGSTQVSRCCRESIQPQCCLHPNSLQSIWKIPAGYSFSLHFLWSLLRYLQSICSNSSSYFSCYLGTLLIFFLDLSTFSDVSLRALMLLAFWRIRIVGVVVHGDLLDLEETVLQRRAAGPTYFCQYACSCTDDYIPISPLAQLFQIHGPDLFGIFWVKRFWSLPST